MSRKPHVMVKQHYYLDWLKEYGSFSLGDFAMTFDVSEATARRNLDGLIAQGKVRKHTEHMPHGSVILYSAVESEDNDGNEDNQGNRDLREGHSQG